MSTNWDSTLELGRQLLEQSQIPLRLWSSGERLVRTMSVSDTWSEDMCAGPTYQPISDMPELRGYTP